MTIQLPNEILNRVMRFNSHPTADIIRPYINKINSDNFFELNVENITRHIIINGSPYRLTNEDRFEIYALSKRLNHKYRVKFVNDLPFSIHDEKLNHIPKDKLMILFRVDVLMKRVI